MISQGHVGPLLGFMVVILRINMGEGPFIIVVDGNFNEQ